MIYAGAVLILFLFVIMVLNPRIDTVGGRPSAQTIAAIIFTVTLVILLGGILWGGKIAPATGQFTPEIIAQPGARANYG